jgi:glycosyltransferase involved in cell wall biosynthesis
MAPPDHATSSSDSVVAEQRDSILAPHHMTRTATPIPRGVADVTANAAVVPGRLLVLSSSQRDADEHLAAVAARIEPLRKAGWRIEWLAAAPQPTRWTDRTALRRTDTGSHLVAQEAYAAARAAYDRARLDAPPAGYFRRVEQRLSLTKHPPAGARRPGAVKRVLARLAFRLVRPLRKLQERLTPPAPRRPAAPPTPPVPPAADGVVDLGHALATCGQADMVVLLAAEPRHLEWLLQLTPGIGLERPIDSTLHVLFAPNDSANAQKGEVDLETLAQRWRTGSPFRNVYFHAADAAAAAARSRQTGLDVRCGSPLAVATGSEVPPSLTVDRHGPVALQITALWGRTGSTSIFDSQARFLIQRGFLVARIFVEHWPHHGEDRVRRIVGMVAENFESVRPHAWAVVERDDSDAHRERLIADPEFASATTLRRMAMLFAEPTSDDRVYLAWLARHARLSLVNHLPHVLFAASLTRAPMVFETHDIYTKLLATHGVPQFVPESPAPAAVQLSEEAAIIAKAAACVNLSEEDQAVVAPHARFARVIRPYARSRSLTRRSWPEVVAANKLGPHFLQDGRFDLMLWGDWHGGNIAGVKWFAEEVMPRCPRLAKARIVLVGRVARGLPEGLAERARFLVAGFVDRLDDFIVRTKVLLIPDQGGSGISIKAMDAFAFGRPFVSTSAGMRCVDVGDTGYSATDDPAAFGAEIEKLLDSRAERDRRAATARRLYDLNFSREAYAGSWETVLAAAAPDALRAATAAAPAGTAPSTVNHTTTRTMTKANQAGDHKVRISIIICTYDRYDVLPDAIASAQAQDLPAGEFEIIVVDNSPDQAKAAQWAADYAQEPHVRYHCEPVPGLSNARNVGTDMARGAIVAFMDDDAIASPQWAAELLAAYEAYPDAGVVGGLVTPKWIGERSAPWLHEDNIGYLSIVDWGKERRPLASNEWVAGTNISFRRDVLLAVGGFSRSLGRVGSGASLLSNEETAVSEKIHEIGKISVYAPAAAMQHVIDPKRLSRDWFRKRAAWQAVSDFIKDPKRFSQYAPQAVKHLHWALEGGHRKVPFGTFHATDDKTVFKDDMGVMYDLVIALLAGGFERPDSA